MSIADRLGLDNPVLLKELRTKMRGARAHWILAGYLFFVSFVLFIQYLFWSNNVSQYGGAAQSSKMGQQFFMYIALTQAFLVAFITPAITSGAITVEREQRTLEMLEMTRLSRGAIVMGKLISATGFIALLLVSTLPVTSICFMLGGVSPEMVAYTYLLLLSASFIAAALGMVWSTVARTTAAAVMYTYGSLVLPPIIYTVVLGLGMATAMGGSSSGAPMMLAVALGMFGMFFPDAFGYGNASALQSWGMQQYFSISVPMWTVPVLTYLLIGIILAAVATARMETYPERKAWVQRGLLALFLAQQSFFFFGARFSTGGQHGLATLAGMNSAPTISLLLYPVAILIWMIPVFSTGDILVPEARRIVKYLMWGWTPTAMRRGKLASGLPFLVALTAIIFGLYILSFVLIGRLGDILSQRSLIGPIAAGAHALPKAAAAVAAAVVGLSAVGFLSSVLTRNRWAAMALAFAAVIVIMIVPAASHAIYSQNMTGNTPSPLINLYYLNPLLAIGELADSTGPFWRDAPLMFSGIPIWRVQVIAYGLVTVLCGLLSVPCLAHISAQRLGHIEVIERHD